MLAAQFRNAYQARLTSGWQPDPAQQTAVGAMSNALSALATHGHRRIKGLYLHGPVGRGKTQLLNLFMEHIGAATARRTHMHAFMIEIHERLFEIKAGDPVVQIARNLAAECRVLGFDEFYVSNIADGMLLGRLFQHLFQNGVLVVATSNWPMHDLYPDGRNRKSLLPFIRVLEANMHAIDLGEGQDYRQSEEGEWQLYVLGPAGSSPPELGDLFQRYAGSAHAAPPPAVPAKAFRGRCGWYRFADLCERPLGRAEYADLLRHLDTLVIEGIPAFAPDESEPALRLVTLIDLCYERRCRVIASAADYPEQLCAGGPAAAAFRRVTSRLSEMQSWV